MGIAIFSQFLCRLIWFSVLLCFTAFCNMQIYEAAPCPWNNCISKAVNQLLPNVCIYAAAGQVGFNAGCPNL